MPIFAIIKINNATNTHSTVFHYYSEARALERVILISTLESDEHNQQYRYEIKAIAMEDQPE